MIGLEYIRKLYDDTTITLSEKLGVTKGLISQWENGKKPIPDKRLDELSALYNVPKDYFSRELTKLEQLRITRDILLSKSKEDINDNIQKELQTLEDEIEVEEILREVRCIIINTKDNNVRLSCINKILKEISNIDTDKI